MQVVHNGGYGGYQIAVTRSGPNAFPFPIAWNFGSAQFASRLPAPKLFTLKNAGFTNLLVGNINVYGSAASDFTILDDLISGQAIPAQGSATFKAAFTPSALGERTAEVEIPSNDPDTPVTLMNLTGQGVGVFPQPQPLVTSAPPGGLNFGTIWNTRSLTITNTGSQAIKLGSLTLAGLNSEDFAISANGCDGVTLAPLAGCTFTVTFNPTASGSRSAEVQIPSNSA